jgi:hypothetical protein
VLGFQFAILLLGTACWGLLLREAGIFRGFWPAFRARASGFALTYLTPSVSFSGVPVRAVLYTDAAMNARALYATIAVDTFVEVAGKFPCIIAGFFFFVFLARPGAVFAAASAALLAAIVAGLAVVVAKMSGSRPFLLRACKKLIGPVARRKPRLAVRMLKPLREFERSLRVIVRSRTAFLGAVLIAIAIGVVEVFQTLFVLGALGSGGLPQAFAIFSSVIFQSLGGMEGTHLFVFALLGMGATSSLVYTIALRIGQMTMVFLGLVNIVAWRLFQADLRDPLHPAAPGKAGSDETDGKPVRLGQGLAVDLHREKKHGRVDLAPGESPAVAVRGLESDRLPGGHGRSFPLRVIGKGAGDAEAPDLHQGERGRVDLGLVHADDLALRGIGGEPDGRLRARAGGEDHEQDGARDGRARDHRFPSLLACAARWSLSSP